MANAASERDGPSMTQRNGRRTTIPRRHRRASRQDDAAEWSKDHATGASDDIATRARPTNLGLCEVPRGIADWSGRTRLREPD